MSGAKLSDAELILFGHNDMNDLAEKLEQQRGHYQNALVISETVFSMDGDRAPASQLRELSDRHAAWLYLDDAHGFGVQLATGTRYSGHADINMGTLSKAAGSYGGYICGSHALCEFLRNRARPFVFATGLPPAVVGAALSAIDLIEQEPQHSSKPLERAQYFCELIGLAPPESQIVPLILGEPATALFFSALLEEEGFLVTAIRPPTVPQGTARLRLTFRADQTELQIEQLAERIGALLQTKKIERLPASIRTGVSLKFLP